MCCSQSIIVSDKVYLQELRMRKRGRGQLLGAPKVMLINKLGSHNLTSGKGKDWYF
jgi:hypothetical protein